MKNEVYFDFFCPNFLRVCLEALDMPTNSQEVSLHSNKTIAKHGGGKVRRVDLCSTEEHELRNKNSFVFLQSAMGRHAHGNRVKLDSDLAKLAMEMVNECKRSALGLQKQRRPPFGVLTHYDGDKCMISVYTLIYVNRIWTMTLLKIFEAPVLVLGEDDDEDSKTIDVALYSTLQIALACHRLRCEISQEKPTDFAKLLLSNISNLPLPGHMFTPSDMADAPNTVNKPQGNGGPTSTGEPSCTNCPCPMYKICHTIDSTNLSKVDQVVHVGSQSTFVRKTDKDIDGVGVHNSFNIEASIALKLASVACASLVRFADICLTHRCLHMEALSYFNIHEVRGVPSYFFKAGIDIAKAVAALHTINCAHCDIKAAAVLTRRDDATAKVCATAAERKLCPYQFVLYDFNLGTVNADELDPGLVHVGTPGWSHQASHVLPAKEHDCRSLGLLLAYFCTASSEQLLWTDSDGYVCPDGVTREFEAITKGSDLTAEESAFLRIAFDLYQRTLTAVQATDLLQQAHDAFMLGPRAEGKIPPLDTCR